MKCETFSSECFSYDREIATIQIDFVLVSFHTLKKKLYAKRLFWFLLSFHCFFCVQLEKKEHTTNRKQSTDQLMIVCVNDSKICTQNNTYLFC